MHTEKRKFEQYDLNNEDFEVGNEDYYDNTSHSQHGDENVNDDRNRWCPPQKMLKTDNTDSSDNKVKIDSTSQQSRSGVNNSLGNSTSSNHNNNTGTSAISGVVNTNSNNSNNRNTQSPSYQQLHDEENRSIFSGSDQQTNLYFSNMPHSISSEVLGSIAQDYGEIQNAKVIINLQTGISKGFGFVNFRRPQDALNALNSLNGKEYDGRRISVVYATPAPSEKESNTNVYAKGVPPHFTSDDLRDFFANYGEVKQCTILLDSNTKQSRGIGLIRFATVEDAERAVEVTNNQPMPGTNSPLSVSFALTKEEKKSREKKQIRFNRGNANNNSYQMQHHHHAYPDPYNYYPPAYGYGGYGYPDYAGYPGPDMYGMYGGGIYGTPTATVSTPTPMHSLSPGHAPNSAIPDPTNIYVSPLPLTGDESLLYRLFSPFGGIQSVKYVRGPTAAYGFVRFNTNAEASLAIRNMNGSTYEGQVLKVYFKTQKKGFGKTQAR